jgi:hypothetical protein
MAEEVRPDSCPITIFRVVYHVFGSFHGCSNVTGVYGMSYGTFVYSRGSSGTVAARFACGMSSFRQASLDKRRNVLVHCISCMATEPRHGQDGTARQCLMINWMHKTSHKDR